MSAFEALPNEIILKILYHSLISIEDLVSLSDVCQRLRNVCYGDEMLWKSKLKQRWPLAWKRIIACENVKNNQLENWYETSKHCLRTSKKFEEIFNSLAHKLFNRKFIASPILSSILKSLDDVKYGFLIIIDELRRIIEDTRKNNSTKICHAKEVFYHVNNYLVSQEFNSFFKLPPNRQSLDEGIYYFSKALYPENFLDLLDMEYKEVSSKLDELAYEVQIYLKTKYPNHPAGSFKLFSPEEPLENTKWSHNECFELFYCIEHIMFNEHNYRDYDDAHDIFSNEILRKILKSHGYNAVIFSGVGYRLGVLLKAFIGFEDDYLLKWTSADSDNNRIVHPFNVRSWETFNRDYPDFTIMSECPTKSVLLYLANQAKDKNLKSLLKVK